MNRTEEDDSRALSIYGPRIAIDLPYTCQCARTWPPPSMQWNRSHLHVSWGEKVYTPSLKKTRNDVFINTNRRTDAENFCSPSLYNFLCLILIPKKKVSLCRNYGFFNRDGFSDSFKMFGVFQRKEDVGIKD